MATDIELPKDAPGTPPAKTGPNASLMTPKEFADKMRNALRDSIPSIDSASDLYIVNHAFKRKPELMQKVINPTSGDTAAAREQQRTLGEKEKNAGFFRDLQSALPAGGGVIGDFLGAAGGGVGAIPAGMLGTGLGRIASDYMGEKTGLDPETSLGSKMTRAGFDAGLYGGTSALMQSAPGLRDVGNHLMTRFPIIGKTLGPFINLGSSISRIVPEGAERATAGSVVRDTISPVTDAIGTPGTVKHAADVVPPGGIRMEGEQGTAGPAGKGFTEGQYTEVKPKALGAARGDRTLPERGAYEPTVTEVKPGQIGPAKTRFSTQANANPNARALESPDAITESKIKATIDAIENENAPAPKASRTEADTLEHLKDTPQATSETARMGTQASTPIVRKGSTIIVDSNAANPDSIKRIIGEGFKVTGITPDGHFIFKN